MATCAAGCEAEVTWLKNDRTGKSAPVNREADPTGNVTCDWSAGTYHVLTKAELAPVADLFGEPNRTPRFTLHFVTCPQAERFRSCRKCHRSPCACP